MTLVNLFSFISCLITEAWRISSCLLWKISWASLAENLPRFSSCTSSFDTLLSRHHSYSYFRSTSHYIYKWRIIQIFVLDVDGSRLHDARSRHYVVGHQICVRRHSQFHDYWLLSITYSTRYLQLWFNGFGPTGNSCVITDTIVFRHLSYFKKLESYSESLLRTRRLPLLHAAISKYTWLLW